jgi:hypothetical protein
MLFIVFRFSQPGNQTREDFKQKRSRFLGADQISGFQVETARLSTHSGWPLSCKPQSRRHEQNLAVAASRFIITITDRA